MRPLYFGATGRRLFGVYDAPRAGGIRRGVVLCYPIGIEYYSAHRACCGLARHLAESGMEVLRFDYAGTGDSEGEVVDVSAPDWVANVGQAVDELKDTTGLARVGLIGIRFGAVLAARCAEVRSDVDRLVLWDPVLESDECMGEPGRDLHPEELLAGLRGLGAAAFGDAPPRRLVVRTASDDAGAAEPPAEQGSLASADSRVCVGPRIWEEAEDFGSGGLPVNAMRTISEWLTKTA